MSISPTVSLSSRPTRSRSGVYPSDTGARRLGAGQPGDAAVIAPPGVIVMTAERPAGRLRVVASAGTRLTREPVARWLPAGLVRLPAAQCRGGVRLAGLAACSAVMTQSWL